MSPAPTTCAVCRAPFTKVRQAQTTCSKACKQALYRAEKCNASQPATGNPSDDAQAQTVQGSVGVLSRIWGRGNLSEIECRMLGLEPTGITIGGHHPLAASANLYRVAA